MFGLLTTSYLFFGGAGAGALVALSLLECANARRRFGPSREETRVSSGAPFSGRRSKGRRLPQSAEGAESVQQLIGRSFAWRLSSRFALPDELFSRAWPLCFVMLALGVLCLLLDLGRPDRLLNLFLFPTASPVAIGAYSLAAALVVSGAFVVLSLFDGARANVLTVLLLGAAGAAVGLVAAAYTGFLLSGLASVLFWQTFWLPATFLMSSLSCGVALMFLSVAFVEVRQAVVRPLRRLARADSVLIALEAVCLVGLISHGFAEEGARAAAEALVVGDLRWTFWGGLVLLGLVLPLVMERYVAHGNYSTQLLFVAALVLLGGFTLRWCAAAVAVYDATQIPGILYGLIG